ncbi:MAG TPA: metallophosphoesterase [Polyangiaceae bacterium]|nr:metallophosphoesterase [Polyangiaceae bacterium]
MSRLAQLALFVVVSTLILGGYHYYLWARLVRDAHLPPPWRGAAAALLALGAASTPLSLALGAALPRPLVRPLAFTAYSWMGLSFLLLVLVLGADLLRALLALAGAAPGPDEPARRVALARLLAGAAAGLGLTGASFGLASALGAVRVDRLRVPLARLPAALAGTRVVQISDVHVGPTIGREFLERVVAQINDLEPDLVAITGDLVDGPVEKLREHVAPLGAIKARYGVFFVTGNHEYYSGVAGWLRELAALGVRVLRNERVSVGGDGASFDLAGVDDWTSARHEDGHGHDLRRALAGRDPGRALVLLAHQPKCAAEAAALGVGLQLSGHTHGGQIFPWNFLVRLQQPFVAGLHRLQDTWVYVNRGTGYWGPPMRVGIPAEITCLELHPAEEAAPAPPA